MYDIKEIALDFTARQCLTLEEARTLYVEIAEEYLARINQNEEIRPFLHNYPFTLNDLDLAISFYNESGLFCTDDNVATMFNNQNTEELIFESYDHAEQRFVLLLREPYQEARRIVAEHPVYPVITTEQKERWEKVPMSRLLKAR